MKSFVLVAFLLYNNFSFPQLVNISVKKLIEKILQSKGRRMSPELAQKLFELRVKKIWGSASKDVRNYLRINWIEMPKRIKEMIDIRNSGNKKVDFLANKDNAKRYEALRNFVEKMPSTYEGIGEKFINERELAGLLTMYPDEYPGMYFMQFGYKGAPKEWLITTPEGYFVDTEEDGKDYKPATEPSAINRDYYKNNLIKEYYKLNPEAKILADLEE